MKIKYCFRFILLLAGYTFLTTQSFAKDIRCSAGIYDTIPRILPGYLPGQNSGQSNGQNIHPVLNIPANVSFEAVTTSPHSKTAAGQLRFDAVNFNDGNAFNLSSNDFTAPTNGVYFFVINLNWNGFGCTNGYGGASGTGGSVSIEVLKNRRDAIQNYSSAARINSSEWFSTDFSFIVKLQAGDKISINTLQELCDAPNAGGGIIPQLLKASFSGYRIYND